MPAKDSRAGLLMVGASGHGLVCAEIAELMGYSGIRFTDDDPCVGPGFSHEIVGSVSNALTQRPCRFFVSIGNPAIRRSLTERFIAAGFTPVTLVHPSAVISASAAIGEGSVIMPCAAVNAGASLGRGSIVNTCASVDHQCSVGDWCHVAVGAHLAGTVALGDGTWVGAGATVSNNVSVCADVMVGAGAVVVKDITEPGTYVGVPARHIRRESSQ